VSKRVKTHATLRQPKKNPKNAPPHPKSSPKQPKKAKKPKKRPLKAAPTKQPRLGSPEFYKLQRDWYKKAAESGFKDIETINPESGNPYRFFNTQSNSNLTSQKIGEKLHYYRRWSCFLVHNPRFSTRPIDLDMARLWADGATWADIKRTLKPKYPKGVSDWSINKFLREMEVRVKRWNKTNPLGLDYEDPLAVVPD
jgi:hypothetical protein